MSGELLKRFEDALVRMEMARKRLVWASLTIFTVLGAFTVQQQLTIVKTQAETVERVKNLSKEVEKMCHESQKYVTVGDFDIYIAKQIEFYTLVKENYEYQRLENDKNADRIKALEIRMAEVSSWISQYEKTNKISAFFRNSLDTKTR